MTEKPAGRPLPPQFKHVIEFSWLRKFNLRERFWILIGCPMRIDLNMLTEHSPGKSSPNLSVKLAPTTSPPPKVEAQQQTKGGK